MARSNEQEPTAPAEFDTILAERGKMPVKKI
jgi:hypothetical protein